MTVVGVVVLAGFAVWVVVTSVSQGYLGLALLAIPALYAREFRRQFQIGLEVTPDEVVVRNPESTRRLDRSHVARFDVSTPRPRLRCLTVVMRDGEEIEVAATQTVAPFHFGQRRVDALHACLAGTGPCDAFQPSLHR